MNDTMPYLPESVSIRGAAIVMREIGKKNTTHHITVQQRPFFVWNSLTLYIFFSLHSCICVYILGDVM